MSKKYSIGIDLGGTKIIAGIVNEQTGEVVVSCKKKTKKEKGTEVITKKIISILDELLKNPAVKKEEINSIGIGLAGQVDRENGVLISAPNLECYAVKFKQILEEKFDIPVYAGNDVEVATIGEKTFGAGAGYKNFVCIFVGTGVGSGIVLDGKIHLGATGTAGEIGHIIVSSGGRACGCGGNGCLEAYASRSAIEHKIKGAIKKGHQSVIIDYIKQDGAIRSRHLKSALDKQDEIVLNCITEAAEYLSSGIASIINFLNPELIIIGGGLIEAVDFFFDLTKSKAIAKSLPVPSNQIQIVKAKLGDFSGVVGAALLKKTREN
ncbi:MAG: ROK family protein [Candidatus Gastranaerophilales bacterium]|nr:ROK family protein [Candidatus Gastranaerophilales bacterium]